MVAVVDTDSYLILSYVLGFGGAILAIIGAICNFKNCMLGGLLLAASFVMMLVLGFIMYFGVMLIITLVLLALGAVLSYVVKKPIIED